MNGERQKIFAPWTQAAMMSRQSLYYSRLFPNCPPPLSRIDILISRLRRLSTFVRIGAKYFVHILRWLDWIFLGGYLPTLSINYVAMSKDMGKRLPQLYYIKMKTSYDLGFIAIGVAIATWRRHYVFYLSFCFSVPGVFLRNRLRKFVPTIIASVMSKFEQILWEHFRNILKRSFKHH